MMGLGGGAEVFDIGLAMSPIAYFAQFALDVEGVAMVTASHNDNGWTGVKMGLQRTAHLRPGRNGRAEGNRSLRRGRDRPGGRTCSCPISRNDITAYQCPS